MRLYNTHLRIAIPMVTKMLSNISGINFDGYYKKAMKSTFTILFCIISLWSFGQSDSITELEFYLTKKSSTTKVEMIDCGHLGPFYLRAAIVQDLSTGEITKGAIFGKSAEYSWLSGVISEGRSAYLDESEIDELIEFINQCDKKWKLEKVTTFTSYNYFTKCDFGVTLKNQGKKDRWDFTVTFDSGTERISKNDSDEVLKLLLNTKKVLN
ncbi:MAG: hypothetical protein IPL23_19520 [Saprospiraceae bacterium]|nr:hypothetical protein [Saprospiraceae bacterium]MBK8635049.1 hypothetical protein [Saprospiraceae bacterium]